MEKQEWYAKHGITPDAEGWFDGVPQCKNLPVDNEKWLSNIAANLKLDIPNLQECAYNPRTMVMVCGGVTARDYLDDIRAKALSPDYDVFCSNKTGEWLLQNGIIPQYHLILDAKKSKLKDVEVTHPDITYLLALNCDPAVFAALSHRKVKRFFCPSNIGGNEADTREVERNIAGPMLMICGGTMAGVRALTLADGLGYRRIEYYGFDACLASKDEHYAYDKRHNEAILDVEAEDGRRFLSTHIFADQVRQVMEWRRILPWVKVVVYGDSFMAHMLKLDDKNVLPKHSLRVTPSYLELQRQMHAKGNYGVSGHKHAATVHSLLSQLSQKYGSVTALDYGCGQSTLKRALDSMTQIRGLDWREYDPSIEGKDAEPEASDLVICSDVMEHIEKDCIPNVMDHIARLTTKLAFFWIATAPAVKTLPDGRNAHISIQPPGWWHKQVKTRFVIAESTVYKGAVAFVAQSLAETKVAHNVKRENAPAAIKAKETPLGIVTTTFSMSDRRDEIDVVIEKIRGAEIIDEPFPHLYLNDIFPSSFYDELIKNLDVEYRPISEARLVKGYPQRSVHDPKNEFWSGVDRVMRDGRLKAAVCAKFGRYDRSFRDETLLMRDVTGYEIGPHTDTPRKVATLIFYLPKDDSFKEAGTSLYKPKKAGLRCDGTGHHFVENFNLVKTVPYLPNSLFAFKKSDISFHGVEPLVGVRDTLLYDIKMA